MTYVCESTVLVSVFEMLQVVLASFLQSARLGNQVVEACEDKDWQEAIDLIEKGGPELRDMKRKGKRGNKLNQNV